MISTEQWAVLDNFRQAVELEYSKNVLARPERLAAYQETVETLVESLERYGLDRHDADQVYYFLAGAVSSLSFISQYFHMVCNDPHMMSHLSETGIFLGYLVRELCFEVEAPVVGASQ